MNKLIYDYQIERYRTTRFLKRAISSYFKKLKNRRPIWDNKAKFILTGSYIQFLFISAGLIYFTPYYIAYPIIVVLWLLRFVFLITSNIAYAPFEKRGIEKRSISAKQRLSSMPDLAVVGIAGSSGKSSVKEILGHLLSDSAFLTPSHNESALPTIIDIVQNKLNQNHKYFLCEMNSYKKGEIKKICELIKPGIGIIPAINERCLEFFKTIDNTLETKFELLQTIKPEGLGIVNLDQFLITNNLNKALPTKLIGYTQENRSSELCEYVVSVSNVFIGPRGSSFSMFINGLDYFFKSPLLGRNHVDNITAAVVCAVELGELPSSLPDKISDLPQIPGRLEYRKYGNIHILDDTVSSNVAGFKDALEVLGMFQGRKAVATPGIVEIGYKSNEVHKLLGFLASKTADLLLLIGKSDRTDNIVLGALDNKFDKSNIIRLRDIQEVYRFSDKNLHQEDVVLLENTLPERFL